MTMKRKDLISVIEKINKGLWEKQVKGDIILYNNTCLSYLENRNEAIEQLEILCSPKQMIKEMFTRQEYEKLFSSKIQKDISKNEKVRLHTKLSNLNIYCQSLEYILAMKMKQARWDDLIAIGRLVRILHIADIRHLEELIEEFYNLNQIDERLLDEVAIKFIK